MDKPLSYDPATQSGLPQLFADWFAARGWQPRPHQLEMLEIVSAGNCALLIAPTGGGKTLAGFLSSLVELAQGASGKGLHTLYVSPLKALAVFFGLPAGDQALLRMGRSNFDWPL